MSSCVYLLAILVGLRVLAGLMVNQMVKFWTAGWLRGRATWCEGVHPLGLCYFVPAVEGGGGAVGSAL